jgi:hypothetical protein
MFTLGAGLGLALLAWLAKKANEKDRRHYEVMSDDSLYRNLLNDIREDLRLVAFLLGGVMILLGIIADQVHR